MNTCPLIWLHPFFMFYLHLLNSSNTFESSYNIFPHFVICSLLVTEILHLYDSSCNSFPHKISGGHPAEPPFSSLQWWPVLTHTLSTLPDFLSHSQAHSIPTHLGSCGTVPGCCAVCLALINTVRDCFITHQSGSTFYIAGLSSSLVLLHSLPEVMT